MADTIRMSGLVAAQLNRGAAAEFGAATRVRPVNADEPEAATAAANLELSPGRTGGEDVPAEELRVRQENIQRIGTRIAALEDAGRLLAGVRERGQAGLRALGEQGADLARRAQAGPTATEILEQGAAGVDPEKLRNAELETAGALLLARGEAATQRASLDRAMVAAENETARHADVERVERAAAPLRGQGTPEDLRAISEALKSSPMSRGRVLDLLTDGIR